MNYPPFRPTRPPVRQQPRGPQSQLPATAIIPSNVLRALIGQSRKRCAAYVEMMQKFGQGLGQLDVEAQDMVRGSAVDPASMEQLREYFTAVRGLAELNEQKVAQIINQEVQFQGVLQTWLYGRPLAAPRTASFERRGDPRNLPPGRGDPRNIPPGRGPAPRVQRPEPPGPRPAGAFVAPPLEALSGYAAHAAAKARATRQIAEPRAAIPAPSPSVPRVEARPEPIEVNAARTPEKSNEKSNGPSPRPADELSDSHDAPPAESEST